MVNAMIARMMSTNTTKVDMKRAGMRKFLLLLLKPKMTNTLAIMQQMYQIIAKRMSPVNVFGKTKHLPPDHTSHTKLNFNPKYYLMIPQLQK